MRILYRRIALALFILALAPCGAQAQFYLTGNVGGSIGGGSTTEDGRIQALTKSRTSFGLSLQPGLGMQLSQELGLGINMGYHLSGKRDKMSSSLGFESQTEKSHSIVLNPYAHYYIVHVGSSLAIGFQAGLKGTYGWKATTSSAEVAGISNEKTVTHPTALYTLGLSIEPELRYELNSKMALTGTFGLLGLGYTYTGTIIAGEAAQAGLVNDKPGNHHFHLGVNGLNAALSIGFRYTL